jgi:hypothetical protein
MSTKEEFHDKLTEITREHLESIGGGALISCSPEQIDTILNQAVAWYESVVDTTSHIIERVATAVGQ